MTLKSFDDEFPPYDRAQLAEADSHGLDPVLLRLVHNDKDTGESSVTNTVAYMSIIPRIGEAILLKGKWGKVSLVRHSLVSTGNSNYLTNSVMLLIDFDD